MKILFLVAIALLFNKISAAPYKQPTYTDPQRGSKSFNYIEGCYKYVSEDKCDLCEFNYVKIGDICSYSPPKDYTKCCDLYGKNGFCQQCAYGLIKKNNTCIDLKIVGCIVKGENGCIQCANNYFLNQGICIKSIQNCKQYNPYGVCVQCLTQFSLVNRKCILTYTKQIEVKQTEKENKCDLPFKKMDNGKCQIVGCLKAYQFGCQQCSKGYYLLPDTSCQVNTVKRYLKYNRQRFGCNFVDNRCVSCKAPFSFVPDQQVCQIDGCVNYFLGGCKACDQGYDLRFNSCKLPSCLISYNGHCKECDPGYIMRSDGTCVNKDEFCHKYNDNGFCVECAPQYFLSFKQKKCLKRQPGCLYNDQDKCFKCQKPFFHDGVRCEIHGCLTLSFEGCKQCLYPMIVNDFKMCQVENCDRMQEGKCVICKAGYFKTDEGSCKVEDPKCLVYGKGSSCEKCVKGYRVDQSGRCQYADQHCWQFTRQGFCTNCDRLYFLNPYNKCQLRDRNCRAYSNGYCEQCGNYFYEFKGRCYPNSKGCLSQKNIKQCLKCEQGYDLFDAKCQPTLTKLSYNSIDMDFDFFTGGTDQKNKIAQQVFTIGKDNKNNLVSAIGAGAKIFYSKSTSKNPVCQVDLEEGQGWKISDNAANEYIGLGLQVLETFYALDIKTLKDNSLKKIRIEYSEDGKKFVNGGQFTLKLGVTNSVETIYFTPVYAKSIRFIVLEGKPNIRFDFFFLGKRISEAEAVQSDDYIANVIESTVNDSISRIRLFEPAEACLNKQLCWIGLQLCECKDVYGVSFLPAKTNNGTIEQAWIDYSVDGIKFECYHDCQPVLVTRNQVFFQNFVPASKLRVHLTKWSGKPNYGVRFQYKHY